MASMKLTAVKPNGLPGEYARRLGIKNVYVEMTNICNFDCNFCPTRLSERKPGRIELGLFKKIVDEIAGTGIARRLQFHVLGEPLLHPDLGEAIAYATGKGLKTALTTNGSLFSEDKVKELIASRLDHLSISLQTPEEEEHASRGTSLNFQSYYEKIMEAIAQFRRNSGIDLTVALMHTSSKKFFALDHDVGVNREERRFKDKVARLVYDMRRAMGQPQGREEIDKALAKINVNASTTLCLDNDTKIYVQLFWDWGNAFTSRKIFPAKFAACGYAFKHLGILHDGRVTMCCSDYEGRTTLGNVIDNSLVEILESDQTRELVSGFERARVIHPFCQRCLGSPSRMFAWLKGLGSIYLFKLKHHPVDNTRRINLFSH